MAVGAGPPLSWWARFGYGVAGSVGLELVRWVEILRGPIDPTLLANLPYFLPVFAGLVVASGVFAAAWGDDHPVKCIYFGATFPAFMVSVAALAPSLPGR